MTQPFTPELITDRAARYEQARKEFVALANSAETSEERARLLQQAALAQAMLAGLEEAAVMIGVSITTLV